MVDEIRQKNLSVDFESSQHHVEPKRIGEKLLCRGLYSFRISTKRIIFVTKSAKTKPFIVYIINVLNGSGSVREIICHTLLSYIFSRGYLLFPNTQLNSVCTNFRFSRKAKAQFRAYKHHQGDALFVRQDCILPMGTMRPTNEPTHGEVVSMFAGFPCTMITAPIVLSHYPRRYW